MSNEIIKHIGNNLRIIREEKRMSRNDVADYMGCSGSTIQAWESGRATIGLDSFVKLVRFYGASINNVVNGSLQSVMANAQTQCPQGFGAVPYYNIYAPYNVEFGTFDNMQLDDYLHLNLRHLKREHANGLVAMTAKGNSMAPAIEDGDIVIIDTTQKEFVDGDIFVFSMNDEFFIKRTHREPALIRFVSENPVYKDIELNIDLINSLNVIGRVICVHNYL